MLLLSPLEIQAKRFPEIFSTFQIAVLQKEMNGCCWKSGCGKNGVVHYVKEMPQVAPLIKRETALCAYVCELVFGSDKLDLDFWVQVDSVK